MVEKAASRPAILARARSAEAEATLAASEERATWSAARERRTGRWVISGL